IATVGVGLESLPARRGAALDPATLAVGSSDPRKLAPRDSDALEHDDRAVVAVLCAGGAVHPWGRLGQRLGERSRRSSVRASPSRTIELTPDHPPGPTGRRVTRGRLCAVPAPIAVGLRAGRDPPR